MTSPRRLAVCVALVAALIASGAARAGSPTAARLFGAETLSAGPNAGRAIVTLPRNVQLPGHADCLLSREAHFSGTALEAAVVLTSLPLNANSRIIWIAHVTLSGQVRTYDSECLSTGISAGRYLLQYLHSPGTSTVHLTLPGLTGSGALRITQADSSVIEALPSVLSTPANSATQSWGSRHSLTAPGSVLTLGVIMAGLSNRGADTQGDCLLSPGTPVLPDPLAYAPGCPAGSSGSSQGLTGTETWQATLTSNIPAGSYGAGYWFLGTPTHHPLGAVSLWLTNLTA